LRIARLVEVVQLGAPAINERDYVSNPTVGRLDEYMLVHCVTFDA